MSADNPKNRASGAPGGIKAVPRGNVTLDKVAVTFRSQGETVQAVAETSLDLPAGSFTSLVGPSGCGKSTLLNVLAGFLRPSAGTARLDGEAIEGPDAERGVVFQSYALFPWFTALGNVEFALRRHGIPRAKRRELAMEHLTEVGLAHGARRYPHELSGGMQQRVALARTLASRPTLLLMDEPFGALDATTRLIMQELLLTVWSRRRTTVVFVTHDVDEALILSDRVYVMSPSPGRIVDVLDVTDARPRHPDRLTPDHVRLRERVLSRLHPRHHPIPQ